MKWVILNDVLRPFLFTVIISVVVNLTPACAQDILFKHYGTDEGFTGASFKTMAQDSLGFLWVSSTSGLYKFDGYTFTSYSANLNEGPSLTQETAGQIAIDPHGNVCVGFPDRISIYDRDLDGFKSYRVPLGGDKAESIWFENEHIVWLAVAGKGLVRFDLAKGETNVFSNDHRDPTSRVAQNTVHEIRTRIKQGINDNNQSLLLATENGLWQFDVKNKLFTRPSCNPVDTALLYDGNVKKIIQNADRSWLWIDRQLVEMTNEFSIIRKLDFNALVQQSVDVNNEDINIVALEQDNAGLIWIASQGLGLLCFNPQNNRMTNFRNNENDPSSLPSDILYHLAIDRDDNVWASSIPKGIIQIKKKNLRFINYLPGIAVSRMTILPVKNDEHLVVGTQGAGMWTTMINPQKLDSLTFRQLDNLIANKGFKSLTGVRSGRHYLWASSLTAGIMGVPINSQLGIVEDGQVKLIQHASNNSNTISSNVVISSMTEDEEGNLYAGTRADGLNKISPSVEYGKKGSVVRYRHTERDSTSIINNAVFDVKLQNDNSILVSTLGGVEILRDGKFEHILKNVTAMRTLMASDGTLMVATKNGLYEGRKIGDRYSFTKSPLRGDPNITAIAEDRNGGIWCLTYEGMYFYDRKTKLSLIFKKEDGLPSSRSLPAGDAVLTANGTMIVNSAEGLTFFDPLSLRINQLKPKPLITQLKINNKVISTARKTTKDDFVIPKSINTLSELTLDHTQNILTLEFSAMEFTAPTRNLYAYTLDGFDNGWVHTDWKNRSATYTNLRPGDYTFKVRASNSDGIANANETTLIIHVLPPPWKTWWAFSLYGIGVASLLFLARSNIIRHERLASKLELEHLELEKVQEIDKAKTNFFANISHEFRTPLTLIQGPVQNLLEKFKRDADTQNQLALIQQNSDRLLRLVNQMLELARLESGSLKNEINEGDIVAFLKSVVESFSSLAVQKRIALIQQFPDHGVNAEFDMDKLEKITSNLISNALKFTPENGAIIINASLSTETKGKGNLLLRVTDTGKGVPPDQIDKIFERFYQVSEDGNLNVGSGIGLALCKELAEFLGGSLTLESKLGEGSKFALTIPVNVIGIVKEAKKEELALHAHSIHELDIENDNGHVVEKPLLLIVEDHLDLRKFIVSSLGNDYQIIEASNGREGLHQAIEQVPTLVLSDVMMPEMDGIQMCEKIKRDHRTSHIPVILLTAKASDESKLSGLGIGADDYIIKPFNTNELILKIRNQVSARARMQEKIRLEFLSQSTTVTAISADEKFLERLRKIVEARMSDEQLGVETLASEIGMSRAQLYRKITALTGISANEFIRKLRLQKAAQLLQQHTGPISQVAYEVGFSNLSYFAKCFKEQFGVLPSEYGN